MDHLPGVIVHAFPDNKVAKEVKCARTKSTAIVKHALAPAVHKAMITNVLASPAFSLMMDESTDRGEKKREGTLIRYFDESTLQVTTGFLGLQDVAQANAANLFECLDFQLREDGLTYEKLIGWNSDGASVMLGVRNSVVSRLKEKQPNLYVLHCVCHISHLMVSDVVKCIPSDVIDLTGNLFWWFHHSAKRVDELRSFQEWLEVEAHKILKKVDTRWLSLEACVNRILEQYTPLESYFDSMENSRLSDEKSRKKMKALRDQLKKPITKAYLLFLSNILSSVNKFNLLFQSSSPNIHRLVKEMNQLLLGILNKFVIPEAIHSVARVLDVDPSRENQKADEDLMLGASLHRYLTEKNDDLEGTRELTVFYDNIREFLAKLVHSATKRLPMEDSVLTDLVWLDPAERVSSTVGMVRRLVMGHFKNFVPEEKRDQLEEEFCLYQTTKDLPDDIALRQLDVDVYWGRIGKLESSTSKPYGLLSHFAKCLLCIPHGNSDSERMFSHINLIRTDHRNQLQTSTVAACMDVKMNSKVNDCRLYEPSKEVVIATRKVTQGSELAPKRPPAKPVLPSTSQQQPGSHSHGTRQKKKGPRKGKKWLWNICSVYNNIIIWCVMIQIPKLMINRKKLI